MLAHAATDSVRAAAFPADEPLDARAARSLAGLRHSWGPADRCWTSPALRAGQTADALGLPASPEPRLRDCDYGRWSGRTIEAVQAQEPAAMAEWLSDPDAAPHGGESLASLLARVAGWLDAIGPAGGQVVAVTHAAVIRAAVVHAIGAPAHSFWRIDVPPMTLTRLSFAHGHWTLASVGVRPGETV